MSEAYTSFAAVYDTFMDETPYAEWCEYLAELLNEYGMIQLPEDENLRTEANCILDLGCGTGVLTEMLAQKGYDMIGIDNSVEMLELARERKEEAGSDTLYLLQDMREFALYGTVGAVISVCDSVNYLLEEEDLLACFKLVNNYLYPKGLFIFDFNTTYKYEEIIGDTTIAENREDCSFIWDNYFDPESSINEYDLTLFVRDEGSGLYEKFEETHYQKGYTLDCMKQLVEKAGLEFVTAMDADSHEAVTEESQRVYVIARECGK